MLRSRILRALVRGSAAGAVGTVAMSALMLAAGRAGLVGQQPPEAIARTAVERVTGLEPRGATADALSSLSHLGFGVVSGAVYAGLPVGGPVPPAARGAAFGVLIWAVSYLGWVPRLLGALPSAERDRADRVAVMVTAHLLYGAVVGSLDARWRTSAK